MAEHDPVGREGENPVVILLFAMMGIAGIAGGLLGFRFVGSAARDRVTGHDLVLLRRVALAVGVLLGVASFPLTRVMGYPYGPAHGRIAGLPFMVAYFDAGGRDYVGPLTAPAALANSAFWALFPQVVLGGFVLVLRRRAARKEHHP